MYAVPLALFLRRARELDFSSHKFDSSIRLVKRVFRVFAPPVVDAVSRHLSQPAGVSVDSAMGAASSSDQWSYLVRQHMHRLGPYAPPPGPLSLAKCRGDMTSLLEEIYMQHMKKVRDLGIFERLEATFEGYFGKGVVSGEEKELGGLMERAKLIVKFPIDYEVFPDGPPTKAGSKARSATTSTAAAEDKPLVRSEDGTLTQLGRETILRGETKCSLSDVSYRGDKMRDTLVGTYEVSNLVMLTIRLSDYLNAKLGLAQEPEGDDKAGKVDEQAVWLKRFRINLRFLADYRNLLFLSMFGWMGGYTLLVKMLRSLLFWLVFFPLQVLWLRFYGRCALVVIVAAVIYRKPWQKSQH